MATRGAAAITAPQARLGTTVQALGSLTVLLPAGHDAGAVADTLPDRSSASTSASGRTRAVALALGVATLASQAGSVAHFVTVRHATCPEHGELVHPGEDPHLAAGTADAAEDVRSFRPSPEAEGRHGHEHCPGAALRNERTCLSGPEAREPKVPPVVEGSLALPTAPPSCPIALIRLAPKGSPPA